jgi:hypothetical protein
MAGNVPCTENRLTASRSPISLVPSGPTLHSNSPNASTISRGGPGYLFTLTHTSRTVKQRETLQRNIHLACQFGFFKASAMAFSASGAITE